MATLMERFRRKQGGERRFPTQEGIGPNLKRRAEQEWERRKEEQRRKKEAEEAERKRHAAAVEKRRKWQEPGFITQCNCGHIYCGGAPHYCINCGTRLK